ncbi:MAG TPA: DinB family protein [Frankiaceae bacterium]|jgi:uncharacterized damage-inducible protein DinB|nr:DinB family protein [Frankiaceae bacterium]
MTRTDTPPTWDERTTLLSMLDYTRQTAHAKCAGIAAEFVGVTPLATSPFTSIGGLVNHMRWVEHSWIENRFVAGPDLGPWTDEEPDREFTVGAQNPIEQTLREYDEQVARNDAIIAAHGLDDRSRTPLRNGDHPTLRWVILHLIEENARHNGHLDIVREMLDGTTGD